jgi:predicted RNA-binding protein
MLQVEDLAHRANYDISLSGHQRLQRPAHRVALDSWVAAHLQQHATATRRTELIEEQVVVIPRVVGKVALHDVLGDAEHIGAGHRIRPDAHALADRMLVRPKHSGHRRTHDRDAGRLGAILRGEPASLQDARPITLKRWEYIFPLS